jgi:hypothetical protein
MFYSGIEKKAPDDECPGLQKRESVKTLTATTRVSLSL